MCTTSDTGAVAAMAEKRKKAKYTWLAASYSFIPVNIDSSRVCESLTV